MNINSPRNYLTLRQCSNTYEERNQKQELLNLENDRDKYYQLSVKLKEENERLIIANKYLQNDEDQLRKRLEELRRRLDEEERKNEVEIAHLRRQVEKVSQKSGPKSDKENLSYLNNCQSQLELIKGLLRKAEEEQEPKLVLLMQGIEAKESELSLLKKQLDSLNR